MASSTIKILREVNGYSVGFIAEDVLDINQTLYLQFEKNPSKLNAEELQKLAELYQVSIPALLSQVPLTITFKDNTILSSTWPNYAETMNAIRTQNEVLMKQNAELTELLKALNGKLKGM